VRVCGGYLPPRVAVPASSDPASLRRAAVRRVRQQQAGVRRHRGASQRPWGLLVGFLGASRRHWVPRRQPEVRLRDTRFPACVRYRLPSSRPFPRRFVRSGLRIGPMRSRRMRLDVVGIRCVCFRSAPPARHPGWTLPQSWRRPAHRRGRLSGQGSRAHSVFDP